MFLFELELSNSIWYLYSTTVTDAEYKPNFKRKYTPYLVLTDELGGVYCEDVGENWLGYLEENWLGYNGAACL